MKNKSKILLISVCVICSIVGGVSGFFLGSYFKQGVTFSGSYEIDTIGYDNVKKEVGNKDIKTVDFTKTKINTCDVVGAAFYQFAYVSKTASFLSFNKAMSSTVGVKNNQNTYSAFFKTSSGKVMKENVSKAGFVSFAERTYNYANDQKIGAVYNDNSYDYYRLINADDIVEKENNIEVDYSSSQLNYSQLSENDYVTRFSISPEFPFNYKANNETMGQSFTIKDYQGNEVTFDNSLVLNSDDNYLASISLDDAALTNYKNYMVTTTVDGPNIAQMKGLPIFKRVGAQVKLDRALNLIEMNIIEDYSVVSLVGEVPTMAYGKTIFDYSKDSIPSLKDECIDYSSVKDNI